MKPSDTTAKTPTEVARWVRDNKHFEGWWNGDPGNARSFVLRGQNAVLTIPVEVHDPDVIEPDDFDATGRMYRPSAAGLALLDAAP